MQSRKRLRILVLMLCGALLAGGAFAGVASARHLTRSQKAHLRAKLSREVKANPRVVLRRSFVRQASSISYTLPITLRFRSPSTLNLDLGTLGVKTIGLSGYLPANATFIDPSASGTLGELRVSIPSQPPGTVGGVVDSGALSNHVLYDGGTATLRASPLSILVNPDVTGKTIANGGCSDYASATTGTPSSPGYPYSPIGSDPQDLPSLTTALGDPNSGAAAPDANTVFRTPFLPIGVAPVVPNASGFAPGTPFTGPSGGDAFLFGNPSGGPSVDVTLNALTNINSILRDVNTENALFVGLGRQCSQSWTGYVPNTLTAHVTGSLAIQPDVTNDGRLRLAVATLTGGSVPDVITACVAPYSLYGGSAVAAGSNVNIGGLAQNPYAGAGVNTAKLTEAVAAGTPQAAPQVGCGEHHTGAAGLDTASDPNELGGNFLLFGLPGDPFPSANTPLSGVPPALPGFQIPQPCPATVTAGVTSGGCTISLNGTLTPGTITADVLIGTPGATDKPLATNYNDNFSANPLVKGLVGNL